MQILLDVLLLICRMTHMNREYSFNAATLKKLRGQRAKAEVAKDLGISRQLWDYYESGGFPSVPMLARMMDYFKVRFEDLVSKSVSSKKEKNLLLSESNT